MGRPSDAGQGGCTERLSVKACDALLSVRRSVKACDGWAQPGPIESSSANSVPSRRVRLLRSVSVVADDLLCRPWRAWGVNGVSLGRMHGLLFCEWEESVFRRYAFAIVQDHHYHHHILSRFWLQQLSQSAFAASPLLGICVDGVLLPHVPSGDPRRRMGAMAVVRGLQGRVPFDWDDLVGK